MAEGGDRRVGLGGRIADGGLPGLQLAGCVGLGFEFLALADGRIADPGEGFAFCVEVGAGEDEEDAVLGHLLVAGMIGGIPSHGPDALLGVGLQVIEGGGEGREAGVGAADGNVHVGGDVAGG